MPFHVIMLPSWRLMFKLTRLNQLSPADISVDWHDGPSVMCVRLKQSKTDPFRAGVSVFLGRTNTTLCPVAAVLASLAVRTSSQGPLFVFLDDSYLTRDKLVVHVRQGLRLMGVDPTCFSGHSFWFRAATTAAQVGVEDATIKMLGRYQCYIRTPRDQLASLSSRLPQV